MKYLTNITISLMFVFGLFFAFAQPAHAFTCESQARVLQALAIGRDEGLSKNVVFSILIDKGFTVEQARMLIESVYVDMAEYSPKQAYHMFLSFCHGA